MGTKLSVNKAEGTVQSDFFHRSQNPPKFDVTLKDFELGRTLGLGSYGKVVLGRRKDDQKLYAVKCLNKKRLVHQRQLKHIQSEKEILLGVQFQFLIKTECIFKDNSYLYFVMEFLPGGDLNHHLRKARKFDEDRARFYVSQVILALQYLHKCNIIYRDIKPGNILLGADGFIKLVDFGMAKVIEGTTKTFCGTPWYTAPEIIRKEEYTKAVDWWSLGILLFDFVAGSPPFQNDDFSVLFQSIVECKMILPPDLSKHLKCILQKLIEPDPSKRYGNLKGGVVDIMTHSWFKKVNWKRLVKKQVAPPFVPALHRPESTENFPKYKEEPLQTSNVDLYCSLFENF